MDTSFGSLISRNLMRLLNVLFRIWSDSWNIDIYIYLWNVRESLQVVLFNMFLLFEYVWRSVCTNFMASSTLKAVAGFVNLREYRQVERWLIYHTIHQTCFEAGQMLSSLPRQKKLRSHMSQVPSRIQNSQNWEKKQHSTTDCNMGPYDRYNWNYPVPRNGLK